MRRKILNIVIAILICTSLFGQQSDTCTFRIVGQIFDYLTEQPLSYVTVQVENTSVGAFSDEEGYFEINNLCEDEHNVIFSRVGYKTLTHHHDFHHPEMKIFLVEDFLLLDGITVEAKKMHTDLNTIQGATLSSEELSAIQSESLGEILNHIAGVNSITTGQNIVKPVIHGLHSNRVLIMNNGLRHEFQNWGVDHAPEIDPTLFDEIEVIKGAGTVRFGPDALGGVILVNPAHLEMEAPLHGHVQLTGKTNGKSGEGNLEIHKGFRWFSIGANASYLKQGDLMAAEYLLTNSGKEESSYSARFRIHPNSKLDIEGVYSRFNQNLGILRGAVISNLEDLELAIHREPPLYTESFSYDIGQPRQDVAHDLVKVTGKYIRKNQSLEVVYGYQLNQRKEFGLRRSDAPNIDLELRTHQVEIDWHHPQIGPVEGRIGAQWLDQVNDNLPGTNTVPFIPNYDQTRIGAYWIENYEWENNLLELGVRYDFQTSDITGREPDNTIYRNTVNYSNWSGTIGWRKEFNEHHVFRSNLGTAWRAPNVAELYRFGQLSFFLEYGLWRYTIDDRFDFIVTTEGILDEEDRPVPAEVGYKWINTYNMTHEDFSMEISGYVNYVDNYINSRPGGFTRTPKGVFIYYINEQTDALFWGLDLSADWQHHQRFKSRIQGNYLWAKQISDDDFFVEQPPAQLSYSLLFEPVIKKLSKTSFGISADYTFEQFQHPRIISVQEFLNAPQASLDRFTNDAKDFDLLPPPPGYLLLDFRARTSWRHVTFQFQVRNILNKSYRSYTDRLRYFADGIGRNVMVDVKYAF